LAKSPPHSTDIYGPRFGQIAVQLGYITSAQLDEALREQAADHRRGLRHRIIGAIFFDKSWMTAGQVNEVLTRMFEELQQD
jgi:hypothetical protein